jgi:two-component system, NtrC family, sensor kinase
MSTNGTPNHRRILVIDDNTAIHADFRKILAQNSAADSEMDDAAAGLFGDAAMPSRKPDFELSSASQGQEGLAVVQEGVRSGRPFEMAFVDVRMPPGWDGVETTAHLWEADPDLQVVICTAYSDFSWGEMMERLDAADRLVILKKPFDSVEVLQLASALTQKYHLLQQVHHHLHDLEETVRKRTAEVEKNAEDFRLITENTADLIATLDAQGGWLYRSPSYERMLGYPREELAAAPAFSLVHPEDLDRVRATLREVLANGARQVLEYRARHRDGSWRNLEAHTAPFRKSNGAVESVLTVARDVTNRKRAEEERRLMEVQLRQAQKLESIGQLAAGIAHEINTPTQYVGDNTRFLQDAFASIAQVFKNYDELLLAAKNNSATPELIARVEASLATSDLAYLFEQIPAAIKETLEGIERVTKIVRAMKEFSHPGGKEKAAADLNKAIETTTTVARNEWKYVADLDLDLDPALPPVPCYLGEFNQCILNLVVNAAHAIGDAVEKQPGAKGRITIRTRREGGFVEVRVGDTGTGIPAAARPRIFEPFFTTKAVGKGTGQGLSIVYNTIVKQHGGTATFETETGRGTTFILRLPVHPAAAEGNGKNGEGLK